MNFLRIIFKIAQTTQTKEVEPFENEAKFSGFQTKNN